MNPEMVSDSWEAYRAWQAYAARRFYFNAGSVIYKRADDSIVMAAKIAYIEQFMELRGWRRIPGSTGYAWENWV